MKILTAHVTNHDGWSEVNILVEENGNKAFIRMDHEWEDRDGVTEVLWSDDEFAEGDDLVDRIYAAEGYDELVNAKLEANI